MVHPTHTRVRFTHKAPERQANAVNEIAGQTLLSHDWYLGFTAEVVYVADPGTEYQTYIVRFDDGTIGHLLPAEVELVK